MQAVESQTLVLYRRDLWGQWPEQRARTRALRVRRARALTPRGAVLRPGCQACARAERGSSRVPVTRAAASKNTIYRKTTRSGRRMTRARRAAVSPWWCRWGWRSSGCGGAAAACRAHRRATKTSMRRWPGRPRWCRATGTSTSCSAPVPAGTARARTGARLADQSVGRRGARRHDGAAHRRAR